MVEFWTKGQDMVPPSFHPKGLKIEWVNEEILPAPEDLIYLINHIEEFYSAIPTEFILPAAA